MICFRVKAGQPCPQDSLFLTSPLLLWVSEKASGHQGDLGEKVHLKPSSLLTVHGLTLLFKVEPLLSSDVQGESWEGTLGPSELPHLPISSHHPHQGPWLQVSE